LIESAQKEPPASRGRLKDSPRSNSSLRGEGGIIQEEKEA